MRMVLVVGVAALGLGGCQSAAQSTGPISPEEFCARVSRPLSSPAVDPAMKAALLEKARNAGCLGPAQPQTIIVR